MSINIGSESASRLEFLRIKTEKAQAGDAGVASFVSRPLPKESVHATASQGATLVVGALTQMPGAGAATRAVTTQTVPQLAAPRSGEEQRLPASEMASIARPLAEGNDVIGNAFIGALAESATKSAGARADRPSGFVANDTKIDALLLLSAEWQKAQIADRKLESRMTSIATDASARQAASQIKAGNDAFATAAAASSLNIGMQGTGAVIRVRALNKEHASLKVNVQNAREADAAVNRIRSAVRSAEAVHPSEINHATVQRGANAPRLRKLEKDLVRPPLNHQVAMSEMTPESRAASAALQDSLNRRVLGRDHAKADLLRVGGDVSARMVDGVGQMEQSKERAHQTVEQNQQQVARSNASLHQESARQSRSIAQAMHNIVNQLINNASSAAAQVAGNLRV